MAIGIDHFNADRLLLRAAQLEEGIDYARAAAVFSAGEITRGLLDKRDEYRVKREIVGEIVEARGEQQYAVPRQFSFPEQGRLIRQAGDDAGISGIHAGGEIKFYAGPFVRLGH